MQQMVDFLFKHPETAYDRGVLALKNNIFGPFLPLVLLLVVVLALASYYLLKQAALWSKVTLGLIRGAALSFVLLLLLRPILVVPSVLPSQSFVAILYDTSKSMSIRDSADHLTRLEQVTAAAQKDDGRLYKQLEAKFKVRNFQFSGAVERVDWPAALVGLGEKTNLQQAIAGADADLRGVPLSGIVVLTDGADNSSKDLRGVLTNLRSRNVPVYPVGVGAERLDRDVDLTGLFAVRKALEGEAIAADIAIKSRGYPGVNATLVVEEAGRIVATEEIQLGQDEEIVNRRVSISPRGKGVHHYTFRVRPLKDEILTENNARDILLRVSDEVPKLIYIEGEPRWEYKFLRRALEEDKALHLSTILRTAKNQYLRQGIEEKDQLLQGFPKEKAELFVYKGVIIGSLEAAYFTADQLRLLEDFVDQRGGGFLMLDGRKSYAEGGYQGTPIEKVLPVEMQSAAPAEGKETVILRPVLTEHGRIHPITRLTPSESENQRLWESLPPVTHSNSLVRIKAGATELLRGEPTSGAATQVLLAFQRYGRGRSLALGTDSAWHWRMEVPHERAPLEAFWKQLLRWMVSNAPNRVEAGAERDFLAPNETAEVHAEIFSPEFISLNRASVSAKIHTPSGLDETVDLDWTVSEDGYYSATYLPKEKGLFTVTVTADDGGRDIGAAHTQFFVGESQVEFHDATQNRQLLEEVARESGGKYYTLDTMPSLPEDIRFIKNEASTTAELDLWDLPFNFLVLGLFLTAEWVVRNRLKLV